MTLLLIGVGGTVRGTGSGLGCPDWPRCHGKCYPPLTFHAIVEYSHRASASIVIVLVMAVAVFAWVKYRSVASLFWPALGAVGVIAIQAFLGKLVVDSGLNSHLVVIHFATSLALLALVITTTVTSFSPRGGRFGPLARETLGISAMTLVVAVLGAYVTQWGAALIFADWPLFDGRVIPASSSPHALIHFAHRVAALILGLGLGRLYIATRGKERYRPVHILAAVAAAMWLLQALAGAANIWTKTASWAVIAHVLGGAVLWGASVAMVVLAYRLTASGAATSGETPGTHADTHPRMGQRVRAYFMLTKPRVIELLLITTVPAMVVAAHGWPSLALIGATLLGGSFAAGGAGAINCYVDRDIDDLMERTSGRPVPAGQIEPPRALAFGIVFFWTPPHFWALSLRYTEDYAAAKVPMLPVVRGAQATARHILLYTLSLLGVSLLLYPLGSLGPIYLVSAIVLGVLFVRRGL